MKDKEKKVYIIEGNPIANARARFGKRRVWDSQKEKKLFLSLNLAKQHENQALYEGALAVEAVFYMKMPKKSNKEGCYHTSKPDVDNLLKFIFDLSNKVLFYDDAKVCKVQSKKVYDKHPRTEFTIIELDRKL